MQRLLWLSALLFLIIGCQDRGFGTQDIETIPSVTSKEKLTLRSATPKNNSYIAQRAYINIALSATLEASSVNTETITFKQGSTPIEIEITVINNLIYIRPVNTTLVDNKEYLLTIKKGIKDYFGNALKEAITLKYTCKHDFWESVDAGRSHSLAKSKDGDLYMWGGNTKKELFIKGEYISVNMPFPVPGDRDIAAYNAGSFTSAVVEEDGLLSTSGFLSISEGISDVKQVSLGDQHGVVVYDNGTLYSWGSNERGQLGDLSILSKIAPSQESSQSDAWNDNKNSVSAGYSYTMAIKNDGTLWGWGANDYGQLGIKRLNEHRQPTQEDTNATDWSTVSSGASHTLALKTDGTLWAWGNNGFGALGDGSTLNSRKPIHIKVGTAFKRISAGYNHSLAIDANGALWSWGDNENGQLGIGSTTNISTPQKVGISNNWVTVSAGKNFSIGTQKDGSLWTWGYNRFNQLGIEDTNDQVRPVEVK